MAITFTDESLMPFGKHKGQKLANVPADYLIWLHDQGNVSGPLSTYLKDNLSVLKEEVKQKAKAR